MTHLQSKMNNFPVKVGDVVVTQFSAYQHWSLVSGRICPLGKKHAYFCNKEEYGAYYLQQAV